MSTHKNLDWSMVVTDFIKNHFDKTNNTRQLYNYDFLLNQLAICEEFLNIKTVNCNAYLALLFQHLILIPGDPKLSSDLNQRILKDLVKNIHKNNIVNTENTNPLIFFPQYAFTPMRINLTCKILHEAAQYELPSNALHESKWLWDINHFYYAAEEYDDFLYFINCEYEEVSQIFTQEEFWISKLTQFKKMLSNRIFYSEFFENSWGNSARNNIQYFVREYELKSLPVLH